MDEEARRALVRRHLQDVREAVLWKLEGLSERDARRPLTPTGTNLAGLVKHCANVEYGYFGPTFGRTWAGDHEAGAGTARGDSAGLVTDEQYDADPQADWFLTADESVTGVVDLYRRVWTFADETLDLPLDTTGRVPHWPAERSAVTLESIAWHVVIDLTRHAGHADILREGLDGVVGRYAGRDNMPGAGELSGGWSGYVANLQRLADEAGSDL